MTLEYNFQGKTILIAEDDTTNFLFLEALLKNKNANIIWVKTGEMAINEIKNNPSIDIILMDIKMPEMNGFDATKKIKEISPKTPIIAQTAYALFNEKEKIINNGYDGYISKPIESEALLKTIAKFLTK